MRHGDRLPEGETLSLHLGRLRLEEKPYDTCHRSDTQPPDVALDQPSPETAPEESSCDVVDKAEHLGPSDLETRRPPPPATAAVQVRGHDRERPADDAHRGETALLVS